jgi:PAS domain S-box-containing protein
MKVIAGIKKLLTPGNGHEVNFKKGAADRKLKIKIIFLFLMPLAIFVFAFVSLIHYQQLKVTNFKRLEVAIEQSIQLSEIIHELQKERGTTTIYLASEGKTFAEQLELQRQLTDHLIPSDSANSAFEYQSFNTLKLQLKQHRMSVDYLEVTESSALWLYNRQIDDLITKISEMVKDNAASSLTRKFFAYVNFLNEKEQIGIERALLGSAFTRNAFNDKEYAYYLSLQTKQAVFSKELYHWVSPEIALELDEIKNSTEYQKVQKYRNIAHLKSNVGGFDVDSKAWFNMMTVNIDQLKLMEKKIAKELLDTAHVNWQKVSDEKWLWVVSFILITLLTIVYGIKLIVNIDRAFFRQLKEYRMIMENSTSALMAINASKRDIVFCNSQFSKSLGYPAEQIASLNIVDVFLKDTREQTQALFQSMVAGEINHLAKITLLKRDGAWLQTELSCFPIQIQSSQYLVIDVKDISDEQHALDRLHRSQVALETVLNSVSAAVSVIDNLSGEVIYLNSWAESIKNEQHQVEPLWALIAPTTNTFIEQSTANTAEKSEYSEHTYNKSRKRWYQVTYKVINWHDNRQVTLRMLDDITERYTIEHKNRNLLVEIRDLSLKNFNLQEIERKQIAADLHDQFGQTMTGVTLQAEFIHHSVKDDDSEAAQSALKIIDTIQQLISSMRDITNQLRPILLDQLGLVEALRELVHQWQLVEKDIHFTFNTNNMETRLSDLMQISLYRIVQESLTNVCKHSQARHVTVDLRIGNDADKKELLLSITDDGKGFNREEVRCNGVGLINMRERVEALGGEFKLITNKGQGVSTFVKIVLTDQMVGEQ